MRARTPRLIYWPRILEIWSPAFWDQAHGGLREKRSRNFWTSDARPRTPTKRTTPSRRKHSLTVTKVCRPAGEVNRHPPNARGIGPVAKLKRLGGVKTGERQKT